MSNISLNIIAFDLSAKRTGWAAISDGAMEAGFKEFPVGKKENPDLRYAAFSDWLQEMLDLQRPDVVAFEETHMQSKAGAYLAVGFYTRIIEQCARRDIRYITLSPLSLKKWATGSGKADKDAMKAECARRIKWYDPTEDNGGDVADALLLLLWAKENHDN